MINSEEASYIEAREVLTSDEVMSDDECICFKNSMACAEVLTDVGTNYFGSAYHGLGLWACQTCIQPKHVA